jgi:hypothetical protein
MPVYKPPVLVGELLTQFPYAVHSPAKSEEVVILAVSDASSDSAGNSGAPVYLFRI